MPAVYTLVVAGYLTTSLFVDSVIQEDANVNEGKENGERWSEFRRAKAHQHYAVQYHAQPR